eukprot:s682_g6.t1
MACRSSELLMKDRRHPHLRFAAFSREFDERFIADYPRLVKDASVVVSLYGDEATGPALRFAAEVGKPCVIVPCNECVQFYPDYNKTYEGFCEALLHDAYWYGGHFELVLLTGMPFSRTLLVQNPMGFPHHEYTVGAMNQESLVHAAQLHKLAAPARFSTGALCEHRTGRGSNNSTLTEIACKHDRPSQCLSGL